MVGVANKIYANYYSFSLMFDFTIKLDWLHVLASSTILRMSQIVPRIIEMWKSYGTSIHSPWDNSRESNRYNTQNFVSCSVSNDTLYHVQTTPFHFVLKEVKVGPSRNVPI